MLSRSISTALKGKGKAIATRAGAALPSSSSTATMSTPSILQAGPSRATVAAYSTASSSIRKNTCTCGLASSASRLSTPPSSILVHKARLHGTAAQKQKNIPEIADLPVREYHEIADQTMDQLTDTLEALQEELADDEFDVEYSSGVLTVKLPNDKGTYVINKQPPNKQIWLSSPLSGPKRYDYSNEDQQWFYTRDGSFMLELLEEELSEKLGTKVSF